MPPAIVWKRKKKEAEDTARLLTGKTLKLSAKAGQGGRLFGSVTTKGGRGRAEKGSSGRGGQAENRHGGHQGLPVPMKAVIKLAQGITAKMTVMVSE